jgi:hypothetical protein
MTHPGSFASIRSTIARVFGNRLWLAGLDIDDHVDFDGENALTLPD